MAVLAPLSGWGFEAAAAIEQLRELALSVTGMAVLDAVSCSLLSKKTRRLKYEEALFSYFGGVSWAARSMRPSGKVSAFMNQNPRKVAAFVSECLDYK